MGYDLPLDAFRTIANTCGVSTLLAAGASSFILCGLVYTISGVSSRLLSRTYNRLAIKDQHRWNSGLNRASLGFLLSLIGLRVLWEGSPDDVVYGKTELLTHTAAFALGFFIFELRDSLNMYLAHNVREDILILHHFLGVCLYLLTLSTSSYLYFSCVCLVQEIHMPLTHMGWIMAKQGRDTDWKWDVNQYLLITVWVVFRNGCDLMIWLKIIVNLPYGFLSGPILPMLYIVVGMGLLSFYLNPWWLKLKIMQIRRRNEKYRRLVEASKAPRATMDELSGQKTAAHRRAHSASGVVD
eukprot:TRINITY_DN5825_c0_g1_i2.p1 TRINITY_DN5825_c0_g1~~TRINITY_DN5825_c0_g1_i2.p1  ORF type:complete len:297 (+),score=29.68 TRINITY_DN5825_c0_g1_i2:78-968(+)